MNVWTKLRRLLDEAATILANGHSVAHDELLRAVVDGESNCKQHQTHHEQRAVVDAAPNDLAHFLRDDSRHGVHWLEKRAESLCEIRNSDPVSGTEQHHHGFSNHAAESQQNCRNYSRQRRWHEYAENCLKSIRPQGVGSFLKTAGHIAQRVFGESKNGGHSHQGEQTTRGKNVESL